MLGHHTMFNIGDVRLRHCANLNHEFTKPFSNDPEDPSAAALKVIHVFLKQQNMYLLNCSYQNM